jgi:hypothetical protein
LTDDRERQARCRPHGRARPHATQRKAATSDASTRPNCTTATSFAERQRGTRRSHRAQPIDPGVRQRAHLARRSFLLIYRADERTASTDEGEHPSVGAAASATWLAGCVVTTFIV